MVGIHYTIWYILDGWTILQKKYFKRKYIYSSPESMDWNLPPEP